MRFSSIVSNEDGFAKKYIIETIIIVVVVIAAISEVGPLLWYRWTTIEDAEELSNTIASEYRLYHNMDQCLLVATDKLRLMGYKDDEIRQCVIEFVPAGLEQKTMVRVTAVRYANTLVTRHINQLKKYSRVAVTKEAKL